MKMRLNGWQRIGIVASVVWMIVGGMWGNEVGLRQGDYVGEAYVRCLAERSVQPDGGPPQDFDWGSCKARFEKDWAEAVKDHWYYRGLCVHPDPARLARRVGAGQTCAMDTSWV